MVRLPDCHTDDRGSVLCRGGYFFYIFLIREGGGGKNVINYMTFHQRELTKTVKSGNFKASF